MSAVAPASEKVVRTRQGKLRGSVADGVYVFKGVPVGTLAGQRFGQCAGLADRAAVALVSARE